MSISAALEEAYASGDEEGIVLTTAEIDHPSFDAPLRVVTGIEATPDDPDATIDLPLEPGGPRVPHVPCGFDFVRPGADRDGPTDGKVRIDNASGLLQEPLDLALGYNEPVTITFRQYRVLPGRLDELDRPDEVIAGLELTTVQLDADTAEGSVAYPDGRQVNVPTGPNAFFDPENYPGLFT